MTGICLHSCDGINYHHKPNIEVKAHSRLIGVFLPCYMPNFDVDSYRADLLGLVFAQPTEFNRPSSAIQAADRKTYSGYENRLDALEGNHDEVM